MVNEIARKNGENVITNEDVFECAKNLYNSINHIDKPRVSERMVRLEMAGRKCQEQLDMLLWNV